MDLHKLGFKFYAQGAENIDILELIPIYHRWIQQGTLSDLLIDAADYSHVPAGPGVMLIAHEGNYAFDETGNRRGVVYYSKRPLEGSLDERLATVCRKALQAARQMLSEAELKDAFTVGGELQFFANDRLVAPNTDETAAQLEPVVRAFLDKLYAGVEYTLEREQDPKERFSLTARAKQPVALETLLERVAV